MTTLTTTATPRIWVGCLAAYNNGTLHGEWIDLDEHLDADDIHQVITDKILHTSTEHDPHGLYGPAEEWFIADSDEFHGYPISEYMSIERVVTIAHAIQQHGAAFVAWAENQHFNVDPDAYDPSDLAGIYDSPRDWAYDDADEEIDRVNELLGGVCHAFKFDPDEYILLAEANGTINLLEHGGKVYAFRPA